MNSPIIKTSLFALFFGLFGCQSIPEKARAVDSFEVEKYLGKWYEIARFDFRFERGLNNTTATYSLRDDGKIDVLNKGYDYEKKKWKEANGKARFRGSDTVGELEVSFFGPFYAGYNVIALEGDYEHALIAGGDTDYLWILSRSTVIPEEVKAKFLRIATDSGFDTSRLLWVEHDQNDN